MLCQVVILLLIFFIWKCSLNTSCQNPPKDLKNKLLVIETVKWSLNYHNGYLLKVNYSPGHHDFRWKWNSLNHTKHLCKELAVLTSLWSFQRWNKFTSSFEYIVMFWWEDISFDMGIDFKQDTWKLKHNIVIPTYGRGKFQHIAGKR